MYAIVETGAKQYKVTKGDVVEVEKLDLKDKEDAVLDKVLFVSDEKEPVIGRPYIKGASVVCQVLGEKKGDKTISFRYRRRHASSKKMIGHRQNYTVLKVKAIELGA